MTATILLFVAAASAVLAVGPRLARVVEVISARTGIGEVLAGAILLGVVTSLPGLVLTVVAAAGGDGELAVANALGGVAAQTAFIAVADLVFRRGTLAAHVPTREIAFQAALLVVMLSIVVIGLGSPGATIGRMHVVAPGLVVAYVIGVALGRRLGQEMAAGRDDRSPEGGGGGLRGKIGEVEPEDRIETLRAQSTTALWLRFAAFAAVLVVAGFALAASGSDLAAQTGLSATTVGVALTAVATSTPELVTAVAAARRGAIGLAAGDIIGGNVFDTLFVATADAASGTTVFASAGAAATGLAGLGMLLNGILLAGLMRQGTGTHQTDAESVAIVVVWLGAIVVLLV